MKKHLQFLLFPVLYFFLFSFTISAQTLPVVKTNTTKVYVHYMPWFFAPQNPVAGTTYRVGVNATGSWGFHWCDDGSGANPNTFTTVKNYAGAYVSVRNVDAHYHPLIGPYDGEDTDVLQYHLLLMKYSGIDGVMIDWYGLGGNGAPDAGANELNTNALIAKMGSVGLKYGLVMEDAAWNGMIAADSNGAYALRNYFPDSNYIKLGDLRGSGAINANVPLACVFGPQQFKTQGQWNTILQGNTKAFLPLYNQAGQIGIDAGGSFMWPNPQAGQNGAPPAWYASSSSYYEGGATTIHNSYTESGKKLGDNVVLGTAYQGFFDFYLSNADSTASDKYGIIPRNYGPTGNTLTTTLALAQANKAIIDGIQIATWNDFSEGTIIEPTIEFGFASLDTIQKFTGVSYTEADLQQIYRFFTLRKKYVGSSSKQLQLNQVFNFFTSLQVDSAITLMDTIDGVAANLPVVSVSGIGSPSVTGATGEFIISATKIVSPITVHYTVSGTRPPTGYIASPAFSDSIILTSLAPSDTITITGVEDSVVIPNQTVILLLSPDTAYTYAIGVPSDTLTITDTRTPTCLGPMVINNSTAPIIDGAVDAIWSKAPTNAISQTVNGTLPAGFAAQWRSMYDGTYLYVLVEVKDSFLRNNAPAATPWEDDAVEIYVDGTNSKANSYDSADHQFGFVWGFAPLTANMYGTTPTMGIVYAIPTVTGGYNLEAKIPWSTINGGLPFNGKQIGFDVEINDDNYGGVRQGTAGWYATASDAYDNPSVFGTASLTICNGDTTPSKPIIISIDSINGNKNQELNYSILASNSPTSYEAIDLPPGLIVDTLTGTISGIPTASGSFQTTILATNAVGIDSSILTIFIDSIPVIIVNADSIIAKEYFAFPGYAVNTLNNPILYTVTGLPPGLNIDSLTGVISGTPTVWGNFNTTITATNLAGTGSSSLDVIVDSTPAVHYISLTASQQANSTIALQWIVDSEIAITKYIVQRSVDSVNFTAFDTVTNIANNDSGSVNYSAIDMNPPFSNIFYRVEGISFNGDIYYSSIAEVSLKTVTSIYPNPVTGNNIYIPFDNQTANTYTVRLLNTLGQSVSTKTINVTAGSTIYKLLLDKKPAAGYYQLELLNENNARVLYPVVIE